MSTPTNSPTRRCSSSPAGRRAEALAFDTLRYAKRLREAGVPQEQSEAHAEAAREFFMAELVARDDLKVTRRDLESALDRLASRLTVRLSAMVAAAVAVLGTLMGIV